MLPRFLYYSISGSNFGRLSPADLKRLQEKRLRKMIRRAYDNSRFWHNWMDRAVVKPGGIQSIEDLRRLPLCQREDLSAQPLEDRVIGNPATLVPAPTSGTMGIRMNGCWSRSYNDYFASVVYFRIRSLCGINPFDRMIQLSYSSPRKPGNVRFPWSDLPIARRRAALGTLDPILSRLGKRVYDRLFLTYSIEEILPKLIEEDPAAIWGVTSLVKLLADAVSSGKAVNLGPKVIICGGDYFDEPTRSYFESTFRCPVLGMYAANEVGFIAQECREKVGMHVMADSLIVEVLRNGEPVAEGEIGEMVVTSLLNGAMPMIRYNLGDVIKVTDEECPCGRMTPLLKSVEGRTKDLLVLHANRLATSRDVSSIIRSCNIQTPCQLVQEERNRFNLLVFAPDQPSAREAISVLLEKLKDFLGNDASIGVSFEGPRKDKMKFRTTTSLLRPSLNDPGARR